MIQSCKILKGEAYFKEKSASCMLLLALIVDIFVCFGLYYYAGFGMYGAQKGDGNALITSEEQIKETVEQIVLFVE